MPAVVIQMTFTSEPVSWNAFCAAARSSSDSAPVTRTHLTPTAVSALMPRVTIRSNRVNTMTFSPSRSPSVTMSTSASSFSESPSHWMRAGWFTIS